MGGARRTTREPLRSRWRGQPGRLEVWYTTITDPATGTGVWIHHELVAGADGAARALGWATVFPPGEPPVFGRFGPSAWAEPAEGGFGTESAAHTPGRLTGTAGTLSWDLTETCEEPPLYTFPRWAWEREALPAAQMVAVPRGTYDGVVRYGDRKLELRGATGATGRNYGHGNGERWAWLHADLGGGDVCEVVAGVAARKPMNRLRPLPFVRVRLNGKEWPPGDPLRSAFRLRCTPTLPTWSVQGRIGSRHLHIKVTQPPAETIAVDYADPDGRPAVCHNTERADVTITLSRRTRSGSWQIDREWHLEGTGHAEVGHRDEKR